MVSNKPLRLRAARIRVGNVLSPPPLGKMGDQPPGLSDRGMARNNTCYPNLRLFTPFGMVHLLPVGGIKPNRTTYT